MTTRRAFLIGGVQVALSASLAARMRFDPRAGESEPVLVVVQLTGGNDGLNTVVPHRQDAYYRARPSLGLARGSLHDLDDDHGLHPALARLGERYGEGELAVVHGVGTPEPDRSHFRSMDIWHTAELNPTSNDGGWLGRLADEIAHKRPGALAALHIGEGVVPRSLDGRRYFSPSLAGVESLRLDRPDDRRTAEAFARARGALLEIESGPQDLRFLREAARGTYRAAQRMEELSTGRDGASYPGTPFAQRLRLVARLIEGEFGTRVFQLSLGGFDTHARQARPHAALMKTLGDALGAFQADLASTGTADRVVTLVFSEFGRRAAENGSSGTDHGAGAPVFVLGSRVRGGMHGTPPRLDRLVDGDVPSTTDFRAVYGALESGWMGLTPSAAGVRPLRLTNS